MGYNIAEAVNYGTIEWLERYGKFKACKCPLKIGVELCHQQMLENIKKSNYLSYEASYYNTIKDTDNFKKMFKKIEDSIEKEDLPNKLFQEAN